MTSMKNGLDLVENIVFCTLVLLTEVKIAENGAGEITLETKTVTKSESVYELNNVRIQQIANSTWLFREVLVFSLALASFDWY